MKVALVHDQLNQIGGAERVLLALAEIFSQAPIFTLFYNEKETNGLFKDRTIKTSFLQKLGKIPFRKLLPLMPLAIESFNFDEYDLVISSSSSFAKGILTRPSTLHICYCHTPTRYLWTDHQVIIDRLEKNIFVSPFVKIFKSYLRLWDKLASERVDYFIANSKNVAQRIKKYYRRESKVIYPPLDVENFYISKKENYFLVISRLRPYKRVDTVVKAFNKLNLPLKIIGSGGEEKELKKIAKKNIEFLGQISEEEKRNYLAKAKALIHPQEEDFGITIIEAMASGTPVIAYRKGGALETVIENKTGKLFEEQTWESLVSAVIKFNQEYNKFDPKEIREYSKIFDKERFKKEILEFIDQCLQKYWVKKISTNQILFW